MSLEDPRIRYRQLQNERASTESIPLQVKFDFITLTIDSQVHNADETNY